MLGTQQEERTFQIRSFCFDHPTGGAAKFTGHSFLGTPNWAGMNTLKNQSYMPATGQTKDFAGHNLRLKQAGRPR
jgi:hypothetical protein